MYTLTDSEAPGLSLLDYPAPAGKVIGGAFDEALETNPVPLFMLSREMNDTTGTVLLDKQTASQKASLAGVKIKVPEEGLTERALSILIERRKDEAARQVLFARGEGTGQAVGKFGAAMAGTMMDPVNIASGFIPVLGGTRYAATLERAASVGARAGVRVGVGAAEGLVGATAVELPTLNMRRELQDDYSLYDSLANIAFGTFASAGLRGVAGVARDAWVGVRAAREMDLVRSIEPEQWRAWSLEKQRAEERAFLGDLEQGFQRGQGMPDELTAKWAQERNLQTQQNTVEQLLADAAARRAGVQRAQIEQDTGAAVADRARTAVTEAEQNQARRLAAEEVPAFLRSAEDLIALRADKEGEALAPDVKRAIEIAKKPAFQRTAEERILLDAMLKGRVGDYLTPKTPAEILAAVSPETHANALRAAVAQALEGRRIDVDPVLRQDVIFGAQRMSPAQVVERARVNMAPEQKVGADAKASAQAARMLKESQPVTTERGGREESPELRKALSDLETTIKKMDEAANDAGVEPPPVDAEFAKQADEYEKAYNAIAACAIRVAV